MAEPTVRSGEIVSTTIHITTSTDIESHASSNSNPSSAEPEQQHRQQREEEAASESEISTPKHASDLSLRSPILTSPAPPPSPIPTPTPTLTPTPPDAAHWTAQTTLALALELEAQLTRFTHALRNFLGLWPTPLWPALSLSTTGAHPPAVFPVQGRPTATDLTRALLLREVLERSRGVGGARRWLRVRATGAEQARLRALMRAATQAAVEDVFRRVWWRRDEGVATERERAVFAWRLGFHDLPIVESLRGVLERLAMLRPAYEAEVERGLKEQLLDVGWKGVQ